MLFLQNLVVRFFGVIFIIWDELVYTCMNIFLFTGNSG